MNNCLLCHHPQVTLYTKDKFRDFFKCSKCELIFVPREQILSTDQEKNRYECHENSEDDLLYHEYLKKTVHKILPKISAPSKGLDFGCGRTTLLAKLFFPYGHILDSFDLYFHPQEEIWEKKYDFIILSEVIEHLRSPGPIMQKLTSLLKPGGQFFIKTKFYPLVRADFDAWFYKRDLTHIQFFNPVSMQALAHQLGERYMDELGDDLIVLRES